MERRSTSPEPPGPLPIKRLSESLVNRIAAGEIIHRPSSALKELIENALDAGSTQIKITIKDGGLKLLQIQDNGCGIRKADLPILCERFTTSKLSTFSDLNSLLTYGFRGEALASISHVAHLTVVTKTKEDPCAWKACYADSVLAPPKPGQTPDPKPTAGNDGTLLTVEDLFYNTPTRLSSFRSYPDEYARILDVIIRYATHNPSVSFHCKKAGSSSPDVSTPQSSTVPDAIKLLHGPSVAKELLHVKASSRNEAGEQKGEVEWDAEMYASSVNYHAKKMVFLLFINHRSVESTRIKRAVEAVYNGILPKGSSPFIYLSLQIEPSQVDVNVHPTKREVHFVDEDGVVESISNALQTALSSQTQSRSFQYQTLLTEGAMISKIRETTEKDAGSSSSGTPSSSKTLPQFRVRTSMNDRTLDSMFPVADPSQQMDIDDLPAQSKRKGKAKEEIKESGCFLSSVQALRDDARKKGHSGLTEILERHAFVGIVDISLSLSLIQHSTKLYMVNHSALAEQYFYQIALRQFGNFARIKLDPPPSIKLLIEMAVRAEKGIAEKSLDPAKIVKKIVGILVERREMLEEYFSVAISDEPEPKLTCLPLLLRGYTPNLDRLPLFLMRLGPKVDWTSEQGCFETFLKELAYFYAPFPLLPSNQTQTPSKDKDNDETMEPANEESQSDKWQIQHVLFPAMRKHFFPPKELLDKDVVQIASLPDLYRVFERC